MISHCLQKIPISLVFTKVEVFEKYFYPRNFSIHFPKFKGKAVQEALDLLGSSHLKTMRKLYPDVFFCQINALDTRSCIKLFIGVKEQLTRSREVTRVAYRVQQRRNGILTSTRAPNSIQTTRNHMR
jgi:hypothetical protein